MPSTPHACYRASSKIPRDHKNICAALVFNNGWPVQNHPYAHIDVLSMSSALFDCLLFTVSMALWHEFCCRTYTCNFFRLYHCTLADYHDEIFVFASSPIRLVACWCKCPVCVCSWLWVMQSKGKCLLSIQAILHVYDFMFSVHLFEFSPQFHHSILHDFQLLGCMKSFSNPWCITAGSLILIWQLIIMNKIMNSWRCLICLKRPVYTANDYAPILWLTVLLKS